MVVLHIKCVCVKTVVYSWGARGQFIMHVSHCCVWDNEYNCFDQSRSGDCLSDPLSGD